LTRNKGSRVLASDTSSGWYPPHLLQVVEVHVELLLAGRSRHRPVGIDDGSGAKGLRLTIPHLEPDRVDKGLKLFDALPIEAAQKVSGRRRVRKATRSEHGHERLVLAKRIEILEATPTGQHVVGESEHVVGLVVGLVPLQQVESRVDRLGQAETPDQGMDGTDPSRLRRRHPVAHLVARKTAAQHGGGAPRRRGGCWRAAA
jgi:hypothetical protein